MLCNDFEDRLTDYLDGVLEPDVHKTFAEHALRCPVCHETLERSEEHNAGVSGCKWFGSSQRVGGTDPLEHDAGNGDELRRL